jgi:hypothetical protein
MKKFLIVANIVIWSFVGYQATAYAEPAKKPVAEKKAPAKKEVKKHKKVEGTKVPEKSTAPTKKLVNK